MQRITFALVPAVPADIFVMRVYGAHILCVRMRTCLVCCVCVPATMCSMGAYMQKTHSFKNNDIRKRICICIHELAYRDIRSK
jgi:hypothetical protein